MRRLVQRIGMFIILLLERSPKLLSNESIRSIGQTWTNGRSRVDTPDHLLRNWTEANQRASLGFYQEAVARRVEVLDRVEKVTGLSIFQDAFVAVGPDWTSNIGHLSNLAVLLRARSHGLLDVRQMGVVRGRYVGNQLIADHLANDTDRGWVHNLYGPAQVPLLWPMIAPMQMIKSRGYWIETSAFWEDVHRQDKLSAFRRSRPQLVSDKDVESFRSMMGIEVGRPIVGLHLRSAHWRSDTRAPLPENYLPGIRKLAQLGYAVVRFGGSNQRLYAPMEPIFENGQQKDVHGLATAAVLSSADFVISNNSGPGYLAIALGVPTLITETYSIGNATPSASVPVRYLPRTLVNSRGVPLRLKEVLSSRLGYMDIHTPQLLPDQIRMLANTPQEIADAIVEFEQLVVAGSQHQDKSLHTQVEDVRVACGAVTFGSFCETYINSMDGWLD